MLKIITRFIKWLNALFIAKHKKVITYPSFSVKRSKPVTNNRKATNHRIVQPVAVSDGKQKFLKQRRNTKLNNY